MERGSEAWRRAKYKDLRKLKGSRPEGLKGKAIYIGPDETHEKRMAAMVRELRVIENYKAFSPDYLDPFLEQILPPDL